MDERILEAATDGDSSSIKEWAKENPGILLGTSPQGNNCLHISTIHGHKKFCMDVLELEPSLLSDVNCEHETPLIIAVTLGHASLVSYLLECCRKEEELRRTILQQDRYGFNALHHAIRNGYQKLALELIKAEPALSKAVTRYNESPMFMAVMRNFADVSEKLLAIVDSSHVGKYGRHALHAAARNGNEDIADEILKKRSHLAREADSDGITPIRMAVSHDKSDVLITLLQHDSSLAYETDKSGYPLLCSAATRGQVNVARVLLLYCPDAFYCPVLRDGTAIGKSLTCLHIAVQNGHLEFVEFILRRPQLRKLINMQDMDGKTALHYAIQQCDPKLVAALLAHDDIIDTTILDNHGNSAASQLSSITDEDKPLDWVHICYKHIESYNIIIVDLINFLCSLFLIESMQKEVHVLMRGADPNDDDISLYNLSKVAKQRETIESRKERQSQTQKYTNNTSFVAILLATITFTAAFTLPGGYSSDAGSAGLPIMSKEIAFQAFLVSDTLAMCSSFVAAFICLMGRWEDANITNYYISVTKKLTWFAYMATITAFATGLYTVLSARVHWLAIGICSVVGLVPFLTMFIAKWPILKLKFRQTCRGLRLKFRQRQTGKSKSNDTV
ncbi:unnamed protein product [Triticum turgidum subsp. durum]|uniref:PGG domain-containing protein n=1 Tax=Triticum turgidum subsp. durum TaxID=4567 RepID=A0A9R1QVQ2_TRITD|nr:unnamed protein product [Triticum turgidum subsp. durum]